MALKAEALLGLPSKHVVAAVTKASERFDAALLSLVARQPQAHEPGYGDDPLPDRLRAALVDAVRVCVPSIRDRYVAIRALGLDGDGEPATLASIGEDLGVTRERVRQLRVRAFRRIDSVLPRRVATAAKLRGVLAAVSADANWTDPAQAAQAVVRLVTDRFAAAKQLTLMLCRAAGASDPLPGLRRAAEKAAAQACTDPEVQGRWRFDRWSDAAIKAIVEGSLAHFEAPPRDMIGMKRMPEESRTGDSFAFSSEKLGRKVACESGMELRVFSWLEHSPEVLWYQEQPIAVPYALGGRDRRYYPDAAVWDRDGRMIVVEVKPVFMMYRLETAVKAPPPCVASPPEASAIFSSMEPAARWPTSLTHPMTRPSPKR